MRNAEALLKEAIRRVLADEAAARKLGRILAAAQQAQERVDGARDRLLGALGIAGRDDWQRLSRRLAGIRRRLRELDARLAGLERLDRNAPAKISHSVVDR